MLSRTVRCALATLVVLGVAAGPAQAALTVTYSASSGLRIQGDDESGISIVGLLTGPPRFAVDPLRADSGVLTAGAGCEQQGLSVVCARTGSLVVTADLGGGNDNLLTGSGDFDMFVTGGAGDDVLEGTGGRDALDGGPGNDTLTGEGGIDNLKGGDGNDTLRGAGVLEGGAGDDVFIGDSAGGGAGATTHRGGEGRDTFRASSTAVQPDLFDGGPGSDVADYSGRTTAVDLSVRFFSVFNAPNDGQAGEGDHLENVEKLIGGKAADTLTATKVGSGTSPTFRMEGREGNDTLRVNGSLLSSLDGGLGRDTIIGGSVGDAIEAREGEQDSIDCGSGDELVIVDLRDDPVSNCSRVDRGAVREGPNVAVRSRTAALRADGSMLVRLSCPRALPRACAGNLTARADARGTRFGRATRYSIRRGRSARVRVAVPAVQRARARRRGVQVRAVERGDHGLKTTLALVRAS
jgi:Ca2+-binding RTX toxin-like protein